MDRDLEALWPAAEPPPGFAGRVVERTLSEPSPPLNTPRAPARSWARRAVPVLAVAASIATIFVGWRWHRADHVELIAAEPREVAIGERARALLSTGAQLEWSGSPVQQVRQDRGEVEYHVRPGGPFAVTTPFGGVQVVGTIFSVRVTEAQPAAQEEEPSMKVSKKAVAAAGLTAGALLYVAVREGTVRLSSAEGQLLIGQGEAGAIGADGIPQRVDPAVAAPKEPVAAGAATLPQPEPPRRSAARLRADGVRQRAAGRSAAQHAQAATGPAPASAAAPAPPPQTPEEEKRRRQYINDAVHEQYFPIARSCYEELLGRQPKAAGKMVMSFAIVGDGDAGVVDRVEFAEGTTIDDPEFTLCMRESMYSTIFEPPPPGDEETTVVFPIELRPGEPEGEAKREHPGRDQQ